MELRYDLRLWTPGQLNLQQSRLSGTNLAHCQRKRILRLYSRQNNGLNDS